MDVLTDGLLRRKKISKRTRQIYAERLAPIKAKFDLTKESSAKQVDAALDK